MNIKEAVAAKNSHRLFTLPKHDAGDITGMQAHEERGHQGNIITLIKSSDPDKKRIVFEPSPAESFVDVIATLQCVCGVVYYRTLIDQLENPSSMQEVDYFDL